MGKRCRIKICQVGPSTALPLVRSAVSCTVFGCFPLPVARPFRPLYVSNPSHRVDAAVSEIDWNVELRKVEREFDGLPPALSPAEVRAKLAAEREELRKQNATGNAVVTWARLLLVVSLIVALKSWPYRSE